MIEVRENMNREEILTMNSKGKLNLLIAEHVLGWVAWKERRGEYTHVIFQRPGEREPYMRSQRWETEKKRYELIPFSDINPINHIIGGLKDWSSDISAAWEVADKLKIAIIPQSPSAPDNLKYLARAEWDFKHKEIDVFAARAPEAICKAALLAILPDKEEET